MSVFSFLNLQWLKSFDLQVSAKILKDVKFPLDLDVFDMCTPELQAKLLPMREVFKVFKFSEIFKQENPLILEVVNTFQFQFTCLLFV